MTSQHSTSPGPPHMRRYWEEATESKYVPHLYRGLTPGDFAVLSEWLDQTANDGLILETGITLGSLLVAVIDGSNIRRIVQLGHHAGYSTLLIGFCLRNMQARNSLWSVDIDPAMTAYTQRWLDRSGLNDYVHLDTACSANPGNPAAAAQYLGGSPSLVFIDSSHQYQHTVAELDLWYPAVAPCGIVILHDASAFAERFDSTSRGGVKRAFQEWQKRHRNTQAMTLNATTRSVGYLDICGVGIIQKPEA